MGRDRELLSWQLGEAGLTQWGASAPHTSEELIMKLIDSKEEMSYDPVGATDRLYTVEEICELLKVSKGYIYWLTHRKKIPFIKMQGHLRFRRSTIDNWLMSQEVRIGST